MNRGIYSAATGMVAGQRWLEITTANLANSTTVGFKREGVVFNEALERRMFADGGQGHFVGTLGAGPGTLSSFTNMEKGNVTETGNPLDVAINTVDGMFAVQTDQGTRYTRNGSFSLNGERGLVTKQGEPVLDPNGQPIVLPEGAIDIKPNGSIFVASAGPDTAVEVARLGVFEGQFLRTAGGHFDAADARSMANPDIRSRAIEESNVNPVESMLEMISLQRAFEMAQKSIQTHDSLTERLIQSLSSGR